MATAVDYDPFAQQTSSKNSTPVDYDPFAKKEKKDIQSDIGKQAVLGSLSNLESYARGSVAGVPAAVGLPGTLSVLSQKGINLAAQKMGMKQPFDEKTALPEVGPIYEATLGLIPRFSKTRPETKGIEELGSLLSPTFVPKAGVTALKTIAAPIKAGGKAVEFAQKADPRLAEAASRSLKETIPSFTSEAKELLTKSETAQTLAERLKRARQETNLREAGKKLTGKAQAEREQAAAKFADLGKPADPAKLGDEMQRRIVGTQFTRGARSSQQAARDYGAYFEQAKGFEQSAARQKMLNDLQAMSVSPSVGSAGRKYAAQALRDLQESENALGAEKEFRKYFEQATAPQQPGYGAIEQQANRDVSDIISNALNTHAPLRETARKTYSEYQTPLDAYETLFGKKGVAKEAAVPDRLKMFPTEYPSTYFKNRDTIRSLREQLAGDEAAVRKFANQHSVNELSGKNASQAQSWLQTNTPWIDEVPGLNDRVKKYVYDLAKSEKEAAKFEEQAGKTKKISQQIIEKRQTTEADIAKEAADKKKALDDAVKSMALVDAEKIPAASEQLLEYMDKYNLLPQEKLLELKSQIDLVNKTYTDAKQAKDVINGYLRKTLLYSGLGGIGTAGYFGYKTLAD